MFYKEASATRYKPTAQRQKVNYCFMTSNKNMPNILRVIMPDTIDKMLPPCPLSGKYELKFAIPLVPVDPTFYRLGDYRFDIAFTNEDEVSTYKLMVYTTAR
jgi:hypothetical protein